MDADIADQSSGYSVTQEGLTLVEPLSSHLENEQNTGPACLPRPALGSGEGRRRARWEESCVY